MGNHILRPKEDENLVVGTTLDDNKLGLVPTVPLMFLKYN